MTYTLSYKDRYLRIAESKVTSDTSQSQQFYFIPDNTETLIRTKWTGKQWHKLLTCIETGADLMFPDEANEIIWQFIKTLVVPPDLDPDGDCIEYSNSASFVRYFPDNPFVAGDKAFGWNKEAWYRWGNFDTLFPDWIDNWLAGLIDSITGYQEGDILFNIESLAAPNILAFLSGGGFLPKIEIRCTGTGVIEVELLSFPLGGKAVIELDEEPNVVDILTGGILDPGAFMVELNRDVLSFPPDEYPLVNIEINVDTPGSHVLYICFIPVIDDAAVPLLFGGGLRSVELCGFEEEIVPGIESIVWDGCALKSISGGIETVIVTAEEIQDCLDIPPGGGGGLASIAGATNNVALGSSPTTTSTTYVSLGGGTWSHEFTKSKAIVQLSAFILNSGANRTYIRPSILLGSTTTINGVNLTEGVNDGTNGRTVVVTDFFEDIDLGFQELKIQWKVEAGTGTIGQQYDVQWVVIEYDDISELFVEDIRIFEGELQKRIGGVWLDVDDSFEAIIDAIEAVAAAAHTAAANAVAAAAAAQITADSALTIANGAVSVNNTQQTTINTHTSQIANHEGRLDVIETIDIPALQNSINDHEARIAALEAAGGDGSDWGGIGLGLIQDLSGSLNPSGGRYSTIAGNTFDSSGADVGWVPNAGNNVALLVQNALRLGATVFVRVGITVIVDGGASSFEISANGGVPVAAISTPTSGTDNRLAWLKIEDVSSDNLVLLAHENYSGVASNWRLTQVTYLVVNINPFTLALIP